jgi:hypothetical protein
VLVLTVARLSATYGSPSELEMGRDSNARIVGGDVHAVVSESPVGNKSPSNPCDWASTQRDRLQKIAPYRLRGP